ncbi:MAG: hypothetical protein ABI728_03445 [Betaproteobacteria bacterium]
MNKIRDTRLLIIDPQNDFCDIPDAELPVLADGATGTRLRAYRPTPPVTGADSDMKRLARLIERIGGRLSAVHVTMDSHNPMDIAHPIWWPNKDGDAPPV